MNPTQMLMNMLQNQLKMRNPQLFQQFQNLQKNQSNPNEMINQIVSKYTPEQMANFRKYANGYGITNEQLENFGIKAK